TATATTATDGPPVGSPPPSAGEWPGAGTAAPQPPGEPPSAWRPAGRVPPTGIVVGYRTAGRDAGRRPEPSNWFAQSVAEQPAGVDGDTVAGPEQDAASGRSVGQRVPAPRAGAHDGAQAGRLAPTGVVHHGEVRTPAPGGAPSTPDATPAPGPKVTPAAHPGTGDDSHPERDA
ncbi:MAG TPA: hypothetical protein VF755_11875, partial [Catenuloplanes sp.]